MPRAPTFRARIDVIQADVSVLDKNSQPVHGLTAQDFVVLENGKPQEIVAVSEVHLPSPVEPRVAWMRDVAPDVQRNEDAAESRLIVLVFDSSLPYAPLFVKNARDIGRSVIDHLGPNDLAAVVFTNSRSGYAQDFTRDKARLRASVNEFTWGGAGMASPLSTLRQTMTYLRELPQRRKAIVLISVGAGKALMDEVAAQNRSQPATSSVDELPGKFAEVFQQAQLSMINIYCIEPGGFDGLESYTISQTRGRVAPAAYANAGALAWWAREGLKVVAEMTGAARSWATAPATDRRTTGFTA